VTNPAHPAHPAIIKRWLASTGEGQLMQTEGCTYGDAKARDALNDDLRGYALLDREIQSELHCYLCKPDRPMSPSFLRNIPPPPKGQVVQ
jgi:hypothetical protein